MTTRTTNTIEAVYTSLPVLSARRSTPDKQKDHSTSDIKNTPVITPITEINLTSQNTILTTNMPYTQWRSAWP
jgi:hypothetical protein